MSTILEKGLRLISNLSKRPTRLIYQSERFNKLFKHLIKIISLNNIYFLLELWNSVPIGGYRKNEKIFFKHFFLDHSNLKPTAKILDIGCGIGRMTLPLTRYLTSGNYLGLDISPRLVNICRKIITVKFPKFQFHTINIYNKYYNPKGKYIASEYKFPFKNDSIDFIFLKSVFTHMLPKDLENYFNEISRVLKKEGKCLITYFLLNENVKSNMKKNLTSLDFKYEGDGYYTTSKNNPEAAIAFEEKYIKKLYDESILNIIYPIHYGSWVKRSIGSNEWNYQDVIIAVKNK